MRVHEAQDEIERLQKELEKERARTKGLASLIGRMLATIQYSYQEIKPYGKTNFIFQAVVLPTLKEDSDQIPAELFKILGE